MKPRTIRTITTTVPTEEDRLRQEIDALRAEVARRKAENARSAGVSLKVSAKGALSAYGLGRWPTTLYQEQWLKVLDMADAIRQFIREHPELSVKGND